MQGIYCIINKLNNKRYVGSSKNIARRMDYHHKSLLRNNKHWNCHLQSAWNKYGESSFDFLIIEEVSNETELNVREQYWMDFHRATEREFGYNLALRADRSQHSPETIAKMIKSRKGKYAGENAPMFGKRHSAEVKAKIAEAGKRRKGIKFSDSHRENISKYQTGRTWDERMGKEKADELRKKASLRAKERHARNRSIKASDSDEA